MYFEGLKDLRDKNARQKLTARLIGSAAISAGVSAIAWSAAEVAYDGSTSPITSVIGLVVSAVGVYSLSAAADLSRKEAIYEAKVAEAYLGD